MDIDVKRLGWIRSKDFFKRHNAALKTGILRHRLIYILGFVSSVFVDKYLFSHFLDKQVSFAVSFVWGVTIFVVSARRIRKIQRLLNNAKSSMLNFYLLSLLRNLNYPFCIYLRNFQRERQLDVAPSEDSILHNAPYHRRAIESMIASGVMGVFNVPVFKLFDIEDDDPHEGHRVLNVALDEEAWFGYLKEMLQEAVAIFFNIEKTREISDDNVMKFKMVVRDEKVQNFGVMRELIAVLSNNKFRRKLVLIGLETQCVGLSHLDDQNLHCKTSSNNSSNFNPLTELKTSFSQWCKATPKSKRKTPMYFFTDRMKESLDAINDYTFCRRLSLKGSICRQKKIYVYWLSQIYVYTYEEILQLPQRNPQMLKVMCTGTVKHFFDKVEIHVPELVVFTEN